MKLHLALAALSALIVAQTSFAGDCGCTAPIGPPFVHQSHGCCPQSCCRLFPTLPEIFRGVGRAIDSLLPCHGCYSGCGHAWKGYRAGCGSCCHSPILPSCRPRPCAARLWPTLGCCTYQGCNSCGSHGGGHEWSEQEHMDYVPTPVPQSQKYHEPAPAVPEDMQRGNPFDDDPMEQSTRYAPRRSNTLGLNAPTAPKVSARPIRQTALTVRKDAVQGFAAPTLAAPRTNSPKSAAQPASSGSTTRIVSRISPASHEEVAQEPDRLPLQTASPLRRVTSGMTSNGLPVNPLR